MKKISFLTILFVLILIVAWSQVTFAEQKSITLPKGTKVEKIGAGHFKFILPDKQIVEVKNFNPGTGAISYISIIDPQPPGKPVAAGKQGAFKTGKKLTMREAAKLKPENYIMIDDDVTWLPATITFQVNVKRQEDIKGLSPQPVPPGKK